jgi:hypothetical protein
VSNSLTCPSHGPADQQKPEPEANL